MAARLVAQLSCHITAQITINHNQWYIFADFMLPAPVLDQQIFRSTLVDYVDFVLVVRLHLLHFAYTCDAAS